MSDVNNSEIELNRILNSEYDFSMVRNSLNIAVIGKTIAGKSSFINAFRGLKNDDPRAAIVGAGVNPTRIDANNQKFTVNVGTDFEINFFDIEGFSDIKDTKVEPQLEKIKQNCNIKEFDAIIFITESRLEKIELDLAKLYESKMVLLFFVYSKIDKFCRDFLTKNSLFDRKKSEYDLFDQYKSLLNQAIEQNSHDLFENLRDFNVFNSQISEIEDFMCADLKTDRFKSKIIKNSIYYITSDKEDFEHEFLSPHGMRIRAEIKDHLKSIKKENLNLFDPYCKRTIFLKKKIILAEMFKTVDSVKKLVIGATLSIIPFLDIPYTNKTKNSFRNKFLELFGINELKEVLDGRKTAPIQLSENQINKLSMLMRTIKKDKVINSIDELVENYDGINASNFLERAEEIIKNIFPTLGIVLASLTDDIASKLASFAIGIGKALSKGLLIALAIVTIPIGMTIYVYMIMKAIEKILIRYEEYSLIIAEIIHPTEHLQINLVKTILINNAI